MDIESSHATTQLLSKRSSSRSSFDDLSSSSETASTTSVRKKEIFAWLVISVQACAIAFLIQQGSPQNGTFNSSFQGHQEIAHTPFSINNKVPSYHEAQFLRATSVENPSGIPFFDPPTVYPPAAGLVSRVWHSNGSPKVNEGFKTGSCWCSGDDYCMCTPALAIDLILTSGPDHIWLVRRKAGGLLALMGGFNEVGETVEEASRRELKEEMAIELPEQPLNLFGVYSDPKRDARKHAVSVVFHMDIPPHIHPAAGDDASEVVKMPFSSVADVDMFIDHKTIVQDFIKTRDRLSHLKDGGYNVKIPVTGTGDNEPFQRSVCGLPIP
jgi:8-oxo-dGTP diphosphatase